MLENPLNMHRSHDEGDDKVSSKAIDLSSPDPHPPPPFVPINASRLRMKQDSDVRSRLEEG